EDGIRDFHVTGVQTCALPIFLWAQLRPATPTDVTDAAGARVRLRHDPPPDQIPGHPVADLRDPAQDLVPEYHRRPVGKLVGDDEIGRASCRERVELRAGAFSV